MVYGNINYLPSALKILIGTPLKRTEHKQKTETEIKLLRTVPIDLRDESNKLTHNLKGHTRSISSLCFSPDGTKLSTASSDGTIIIWSIHLGPTDSYPIHIECVTNFLAHRSAGINDLSWSPDSNYLVSASDDHSVRIFSTSNLRSTPSTTQVDSKNQSGDGQAESQRLRYRELIGHSNCVYCLKFNPIGTVLISGSFDETIKVWDFIGGKLLRTLPGHSEVVSCLDFSRDGSVIVSGSFDGLIRLWDATSGQCLKTLVISKDTNSPVTFVSFTPNSNHLITCSLDSIVRLWDFKTREGTVVKSFTGHSHKKYSIPARVLLLNFESLMPNEIKRIAESREDRRGEEVLITGSEDGTVWVWHLQTRQSILKFKSHQDFLIGLCVHPKNSRIIVTIGGVDKDSSINVFDLYQKQ
ncbi:WD40-repeat-containing domain protein [Phakopsora pachyrhizi]|uniref:WD40-repeat-containing domain protein n=1 Tax=Phakopsora pachyrhizi TaxID=170000 RepID=A0AAV0ALR0_PHAPC|nr:WD40-repeat-containing domain protein [Phakopsora pachyrhizi]